ncbi:MAG: hypothetical protein ACK4YO_02580, partial [Candidatus Altarchaeaceae archaeon]
MLIKEKIFDFEKSNYLDEGWIEGEISILVRDKEKGEEFFNELIEKFENKKRIPLKFSFEEIEKDPFVGIIIIKFLSYDLSVFVRTILYFSPISCEILKEKINLKIYTLNEIFLDICDIFKTFKYETKAEVYVKGGYVEGKDIEGIIVLEFFEKYKDKVFEKMEKTIAEISKFVEIKNVKKDEILEIEDGNEKNYVSNMEIHL